MKIREYPADLGANNGDKLFQGDKKTPEGAYFLQELKKGNQIPYELYGSRAYTTNYPNYFDKLAGKTGSGIWLHAVPDEVPLTRGSRGCVVIRDKAIIEVEEFFKKGATPMVIQGQVKPVSQEDLEIQRESVRMFLTEWLRDWETQDVESYIKHYDAKFRGQNMSYGQWYRHKKSLKERYKFIKLQVTEPLIVKNGSEMIIRFLQSYTSDQFTDFGEKTLHVYWRDDRFRIIGEDWVPVNNQIASTELLQHPFRAGKLTASPPIVPAATSTN